MVVSTLDANRQIVYGDSISRDSVFKLAVAAFTAAIGGAASVDIRKMALVGRARAYADLGQLTSAQPDAQLVDTGYVKYVTGSAIIPRRDNPVWSDNSPTSART